MNYTRNNHKTLTFAVLAGLVLLLALRDIRSISLNKYIYAVYCIVPLIFVDYEEMFPVLSFIFPLLWGLPGTYILLATVALFIYKKGSIDSVFLTCIVLFLILEIFASLWYPQKDFVEIIGYLCTVSTLLIFIQEDGNIDYERCLQYFVTGCVILCGVIIICGLQNAPSDWLWRFSKGWFRFGETHGLGETGMTLKVNANTMAYYSLAGIACGLPLFQRSHLVWKRLFLGAEMAILLIAGFLTVSRSWVLFLAITIMLFVKHNMQSPRLFFPTLCLLALAGVAGTILLLQNPELLDGFLTRASAKNIASGGGRTDLFVLYLHAFMSNLRFLFFGMGVTQYRTVSGVYNSLHNAAEQILVCYGLAGCWLFFYAIIQPVAGFVGKKIGLIYWIPLIIISLFVQTIQFVNPDTLMLPYAMGVIALRMGAEEKEPLRLEEIR